jgi:integrase
MQGHIHKRVRTSAAGKPTTTWYVVVELGRTADGRRRQKWHGGFSTRKEAEAVRAKLVNEVNTGVYAAPSKMTLGEWLTDSWLPTMRTQIKASTWDSYDRLMRLHVIPTLGHRPLHQLTPPMLNTLYVELMENGNRRGNTASGLNAKTVRHVHTTLHKALADAIDAGLLATNVAERAKPPKPRVAMSRTQINFWDPDQLAKFLLHLEGHRLQAAWHLAAMTGMRRGEVLGLRWQDVDLEAGRLAVRRTLVSVNYAIKDSTPKTHQARTIDLDRHTVGQLRAHKQRQHAEPQAWGPDYQPGDLVFRRKDGSPVHPDLFSQAFEKLVRGSGLPRIRLHDLRHTHATIALRAGVPVKVISERLGHEDPAFTMKQYAHVIPGMQAEAAALVAALVAGCHRKT